MRLHVKRDLRIILTCTPLALLMYMLILRSLPPKSYTSDLQNDYLPAIAFRNGLDIFTPLTELSARFFPVGTTNFPHPSPHPPVMTLLALPLTFIPFEILVPAWLALNVALLLIVGRKLGLSPLASLAFAAWPPVFYLLDIGQWELVVLALAVLAWQEARGGRDWRAGALFGLAALVKLYPALLVLPYLFRRRLKVVASAAIVFLGTQLASLAAVGGHDFVRYWTEILPAGSSYYTAVTLNSSPYGALLRLLGGARDVEPIWQLPSVVLPITLLLSLLALASMRWLRPEAAAVALLVAMPNVWGWYVVLALPQIVYLLRQVRFRIGVILATVAASLSLMQLASFVPAAELLGLTGPHRDVAAAIVGAIQPLGYIGLLVLCVIAERVATAEHSMAQAAQVLIAQTEPDCLSQDATR